jgi:ATP-dependent Clp protease ATP-binding subunit ClpC
MKDKLLEELKKRFRPEFINRLDGMVVFHALTKENIRSIVDLLLKVVYKQLAEQNITLQVTEVAKDYLGEKGFDEVFGARPLKRAIQDLVVDKISEDILKRKIKNNEPKDESKDDTIVIDNNLKKGEMKIDAQERTDKNGVTEKKIIMLLPPEVATGENQLEPSERTK